MALDGQGSFNVEGAGIETFQQAADPRAARYSGMPLALQLQQLQRPLDLRLCEVQVRSGRGVQGLGFEGSWLSSSS